MNDTKKCAVCFSDTDKDICLSCFIDLFSDYRGRPQVTLVFEKRGKNWEAECLEFGTATFSESLPEAIRELGSLMCLKLETIKDTRKQK